MNNFLLEKNNKLNISLVFSIALLVILYIFFLLMSVTYTYSVKQDNYELTGLIADNVKIKSNLFKAEKQVEEEMLKDRFVKVDSIKYISTVNVLVSNLER